MSTRRQQILQVFAEQLQHCPGEHITTAALARAVGVSEAALYKHFNNKAQMFDGLLDFVEDALFKLIDHSLAQPISIQLRCKNVIMIALSFADKNPGIARLLNADILTGEQSYLRTRVSLLFNRMEVRLTNALTQAKQLGEIDINSPEAIANLFVSFIEGRINQFVRSGFQQSPLTHWKQQWGLLNRALQTQLYPAPERTH